MRLFEMAVLTAAVAVASSSCASAQLRGRVAPEHDAFTPVIATLLAPNQPSAIPGGDGRYHVDYELQIINTRGVPATLNEIAVLDASDKSHLIARYSGVTLLSILRDPASPARSGTDAVIKPNAARLAFIDLSFASRAQIPHVLVHRFDLEAAANPAATVPKSTSYTIASVPISDEPLLMLQPPLRGSDWVVTNGCCGLTGAHRDAALPINGGIWIAQRFAIDFMRIDHEGRFVHGDQSRVENYTCYGSDVLAVAPGKVVSVMDGLNNQVPGKLPDPASLSVDTVDGNHIVLDLGNGYFAFYAHLMKGSVKVKVGDVVKPGQIIGNVGNTGNTSAPHLHFHIMDSASVLGSDGLPYVFELFALHGQVNAGRFASAASLEGDYGDGRTQQAEIRSNQFPLDLQIVDFP